MARTSISYRGLGVDNSAVSQLVAERGQLQAQINQNNQNNQNNKELRRQRAQTEMEDEVNFDYDYTEGKGTKLREEIDNKIMATKQKKKDVIDYFSGKSINNHTLINDTMIQTQYLNNSGSSIILSGRPAQEISSIAKMNSEIDYAIGTGSPDPRPEMKKMVEKADKAKMGGFGQKVKKAGKFGIGAIVVGGVLANMMGNGGQQSNAQLYGQQPLY